MNILLIILSVSSLILSYFLIKIIFNIVLRGFAPLISSRPWVIEQLLSEIDKLKFNEKSKVYALSCGKSGFLHGISKRYPQAELIGVEYSFLPYVIARIQIFLRISKIKILYKKKLYKLDISDADLIYCYLDTEILRDLPKKFKFECKLGTIIISNGIVIPNFEAKKSIKLIDRKGRIASILKHKKFWSRKMKEGKRENMVYFYKI